MQKAESNADSKNSVFHTQIPLVLKKKKCLVCNEVLRNNRIFADVKALSKLSFTILAALIMVFSGAGISVLYCDHTGKVQVAQMVGEVKDDCHDAENDACADEDECDPTMKGDDGGCMSVQMLQFTPSLQGKGQVFDLKPLLLSSCSLFDVQLPVLSAISDEKNRCYKPYLPSPPPRHYLTLIRVLLI